MFLKSFTYQHFYAPEIESIVLSVILSFCPPLWDFNLASNFWTASARALKFHMRISCEKTCPWVQLLWSCDLDLDPFCEIFNLATCNNFWTVSARALLYYMRISSDNSGIKLFVTFAIFGIGHYPGHLCFTNTSCFLNSCNVLIIRKDFQVKEISFICIHVCMK